jgi:hypothetical protein
MKEIWSSQNTQPLYTVDEKAVFDRIQARMKTKLLFTTISDWLLIAIYLFTAAFLIGAPPFRLSTNIFLSLEAAWFLGLVVYLAVMSIRRFRASRKFDRSLKTDLDHSIFLVTYKMRIIQIVQLNLIPLGLIMILSGWESGKLISVGLVILFSYTLAFYVNSRGYKANKNRKHRLQVLRDRLEMAG